MCPPLCAQDAELWDALAQTSPTEENFLDAPEPGELLIPIGLGLGSAGWGGEGRGRVGRVGQGGAVRGVMGQSIAEQGRAGHGRAGWGRFRWGCVGQGVA